MSALLKTTVPYHEPDRLFAPLADAPWATWLDSGSGAMQGRYDIMVAEPSVTLLTGRDGITVIETADGQKHSHNSDPFALLREQLAEQNTPLTEEIPFAGGAVGYFGYDLCRLIEQLPEIAEDDTALPLMAVGIYDWALVCDRQTQQCWLVSNRIDDENDPRWQQLLARFSAQPAATPSLFKAISSITSNMDREAYAAAFGRVQHYLEEGDCYQVNLAQRFSVQVEGSSWGGYLAMRAIGTGPFSSYMNLPGLQVLCTSPERFLKLENGRVETKPIKGTRRRLTDMTQDQLLASELLNSTKDRAENLMIVDLLRNDLGKSCRTGSVRVPELFTLESHATVHHLVSTVTGELDEGKDALDLLKGCFPGGSITGAPKLRAMQIIEELEPHRRGIYCGAIGYIGFDGNMDCNIAIRTAVHKNGVLYYHAGGGIVRDSSCEEEYQESLDKAALFFACFNN